MNSFGRKCCLSKSRLCIQYNFVIENDPYAVSANALHTRRKHFPAFSTRFPIPCICWLVSVKYSLKGTVQCSWRGGATYINDKNTTVDTSISCVPTSPPSCYCRECVRLETVSELEGNYFCAWKNLGILLWWQHGQLLAINSLLSTNTNFPSGQSRHNFCLRDIHVHSKYKNMHHPNLKKCDQDFCEMVLKVFSMRDLKAWLIADDVEAGQGTGRPLFSGRRVAAIF